MKMFRKMLSILLSVLLVFPLFSELKAVKAAPDDNSAIFFIPDDVTLRGTANRTLGGDAQALNRNNVLVSTDGLLSVSGTTNGVSDTSLTVTIDQIAYVGGSWTVQPGKTANSSVPSPSANRFQITNLQLFPGYNRITLAGDQGGVTKKDVFYVLYESGPVLVSLQLFEGNSLIDINQGSRVVTRQGAAVFQGQAHNVKSVIVNGNRGSVTENGMFYSSGVILTPGLNEIEFVFKNDSDELRLTRELYYFDPQQPFSSLKVTHDSQTYDIIKNSATFTGGALTASAEVELLLPYQNIPFADNYKIEVNNGETTTTFEPSGTSINVLSEDTIYGLGNQPEFKRVKFVIPSYNVRTTTDASNNTVPHSNQTLSLRIEYGSGETKSTSTINRSYRIAVNEILLKNAYMLPGYDGSSEIKASTPKQPLNGSQIEKPEFYMLVESSAAPTSALQIQFEPLGTLTLTPAEVNPAGLSATQRVYHVTNFPEGAQNLVLSYVGKTSTLKAKVTFVAKTIIHVDNLTNGQVIELDSSDQAGNNYVGLKGQFIGFQGTLLNKKLFINNVDFTADILDPNFDSSRQVFPAGYPADEIKLNVKSDGPLYYGENTIKFMADYATTVNGVEHVIRTVTKEIKFYIIDKNTPNIKMVRPITPPTSGIRGTLNTTDPANYLLPSPEFQSSGELANTYTTTLKSFDLFLEGNGASEVIIRKSGELLLKFKPSELEGEISIFPNQAQSGIIEVDMDGNKLPAGSSLDYFGSKNSFRIRINNLPVQELGPHVYTAELRGDTGSPVSVRLEINRTTAPFRILAPKANVGKKIVVNKNFVIFDVEAEGATQVIVNGIVAEKRRDIEDRFIATVTNLKVNKDNKIKLTVKRASGDLSETVNVYYAGDVGVDSMYMEKMSNKHTVFDKKLQLTFPKNTVLRRSSDNKIYPDNMLLFGIADPVDGVVGRVNDYGDILGLNPDQSNQSRDQNGNQLVTPIFSHLYQRFISPIGREHFTIVSPYYWISAGYAERGNPGDGHYQPATGGLTPYNYVNTFASSFPNSDFMPEQRKLNPSNRGTLKIAFDPNIVVDAGSYVTVFHFNDKGEWNNIGGVVDMKSKTISVPFEEFGYYAVAKLRYSFNDIIGHSWARNVLSAMYAKGMMSNLRTEDFGADDYTTRGEFAALLVRALDMPLNAQGPNTFLDVVQGSRTITWTYEEIETAARAGIIHGMTDRVFNPGGRITRQEAASMIARALNLKVQPIDDKLIAKLNKTFVDGPNINRYAKPAVDAVFNNKLMTGSPAGTDNKKELVFNPGANLTRAEAGQIVVNILKKYNKKFAKELS